MCTCYVICCQKKERLFSCKAFVSLLLWWWLHANLLVIHLAEELQNDNLLGAILLHLGFSPVWKIFIFKKRFFFFFCCVCPLQWCWSFQCCVLVTLGPLLFYRKLSVVYIVLHWMVWLGVQEKTKNGDIRVCFEKPPLLLRKSAICLYKFLYQLLGKILWCNCSTSKLSLSINCDFV